MKKESAMESNDQKKPHPVEQILEIARWAPSADNTQPWRFEIVDENHLIVNGCDTSAHCVYDLDGHISHIALGALLETITLAATHHGLATSYQRRTGTPPTQYIFDIHFKPDQEIAPSPLVTYIPLRSVQRRRMSTRPLSFTEKEALETAVGPAYHILWLENLADRLSAAKLMFHNAKLRLTMPEAYQVHKAVIEWNTRYSHDRIPDQAVGLDPITTRLMQWVMQSWQRVTFFNRYLAGTWLARIEMDLVPGIACAAHFVIFARDKLETIDDYVAGGHAVQRFWLTATQLNLKLQPEVSPLVFERYLRNGTRFSQLQKIYKQARLPASQLRKMIGAQKIESAVFMGRIGAGPIPLARSLRLPIDKLMSK